MKSFLAAAVSSFFLVCPAFGQIVLFDSHGFEPGAGYALGALNGQNGWSADTPPGSFQVQNTNVQSGLQAASAVGNETNWIFPAINYTPLPTELIRIQSDVARTVNGANTSFAYGIDVYDSAISRTTRFGLTASGGMVFPFVTSRFLAGMFNPAGPVTNVVVGGAVPVNTYVNFDARLNYVTKSMRLFVNGSDVGVDIPFVDLSAVDIADADWHVQGTAGSSFDMGFLDNYIVSTTPIPEPTSFALTLVGALGVGWRRWSRRHAN